ncbi:MAG: amino acid adenylation domain-containing protein [Cyanobacteria bacterium J06633_23]
MANTTAKFDLTLIVTEIEGRLKCILEYNTDLFEKSTIERLAVHFQTLLMGIVANPDAPLHDLPLLTAEETIQLHQWAQTETQAIPQLCLHQLFETQADKTPEAIAVTFAQKSLTYGELNQRANQLAHHLQALGVGPDTLVGICVERSPEMLVGLLAILKAGGAYVPMDPGYPSARLQFMLDDTKISVLLSQTHLLDRLPSLEAKIVVLDRDESNIAQSSTEPLSTEISPDNLAYVIYTSGSTGRPKGVMIPHQGLVNYLSWAIQAYRVTTGGGAPVHSSLGFDATITGLFAPLLVGKPVVLLSPQQEIEALCQALQSNQQFSLVKLTPAHLELLNQMLPPETLADQTQALVIGGEALMGHQLTFWQTHAPKTRLINEYGPTETVVGCCVYETDETTDLTGAIPIGRPIANTQLYVLDTEQKQVPIGVSGELHIGGSGVARGYLNRPDLTREKFIDNPFGEGRLYKTGDLVRYRPDGVIEYLGRIDHQVKIRGFRIELGEIEAALLQHAQIREAVAIAREDKPGQKQLVAYLTQRTSDPEQQAPSISELRQWLQGQLPDYMIPAAFVWLDHIPLTANGKVDRQALPAPQIDRSSLTAPFTAPRSQLEQQLATIWSNVLDVANIGIDDNFFELGGDSILSLQIITQANQAGLTLTLKQLFQYQTIRTLAPVVGLISSAEQGPVTGLVPLTSMQQQLLSQHPETSNQCCQFLHLKLNHSDDVGTFSLEEIRAAIHHLLNHHDALRMTFQPQDQGAWSQHNGAPMPSVESLPIQVRIEEDLDSAIATAISTFQQQLNLSTGPLIQAILLQSADTQHILLIAHQLIIDQTSWHILTEDLQTLLQQQQQDTLLKLPAKTHSFQQWAQQLDEYDQTPPSQQQKSIPVDSPNGATTSLTVSLGTDATQDLLQRVPLAYRTYTQEVLLTALVQAYASWTGQPQLTVDLANDSRSHKEDMDVSRTVGWFETRCPVTFELPQSDDLGNALKAVKEHQRQSTKHALNQRINLNQNQTSEIYFNHSEAHSPINEIDAPRLQVIETATLNRGGPLQIDSTVVAGNLQLRWTYSESLYPSSTIETLAQQFLENLRSLITHCLSPDAGGYTPSDFPLAQLNQDSLERLMERYPNLEDCYPLAPIQQGFLFHALYAPNDGMYITQICCRLQGELDIAALQQTWQSISNRHPILRTAFVWEDLPQPLQVVQKQVIVPWQVHDWRSQSSEDQKTNLTKLLERDRTTGFQPHIAPLMRPTLVQIADDCYDVIWSCHHMLIDGWSMPMLIQEIFTLYESLVQGQQPVLPERRPYRDYIDWLSEQDLSTAEDFWTSLLEGFHTPTPLGYRKPEGVPPKHEIQGLTLKPDTTKDIQTLAQQHRITLNTLIQGTWTVLLGHISGQTDIVFGATTAGRPPTLTGVDTMIGLFINTLPVRVKLTPDADIITWMQALQTQRSEARQYEYSPLNQIQKWSEVPTGTPLFDSLIVFENYRVAQATSNQTKLTMLSEEASRNNSYPLTLRVLPREDFVLEIMSNRTCFAAEVTDRWLHHLDALLQWLVEHPDAALGNWQTRLTELDQQWQQQQAQTQTKSNLKKLRKTRRKAVRSSQEDS